ncbi:MAG: V-type ATP synthase subunit B [Chloroflexi bacterium]|nr:V-type ATP synthase subunit B [Chloroflexota bacterium]
MSRVRLAGGQEVRGLARVEGPLIAVQGVRNVAYDELVEIVAPDGRRLHGRVLEVDEEIAVIQVFEGTAGLSIPETRVRFAGRPLEIPVAAEMLGRVFNGVGTPIDGQPAPLPERWADVNGAPINPTVREYPRQYIATGISAIDGMNTLLRGQKLPIFSGNGLPHDQLAAQLARQARLGGAEAGAEERFAIVFAAMGIKNDVADFFRRSFAESGALVNVAMFLNLAADPVIERLITPRAALTLAEFLAFEKGMHVLVILTDMTNYCEALRQLSSARNEIPGRKGYPGYLYSDLASIYERTGRIRGRGGSITQVPILTMPNDDITHPVPDLTAFITEGQIVVSRDLAQEGVYPPVAVLPSLSRLMKDGIGEGLTRGDHPHVASQMYAAYAHVQDVKSLAAVIGEEELTKVDRQYLEFGQAFERQFIGQGLEEDRSIVQTLEAAWKVLSILPQDELTRLSDDELAEHYGSTEGLAYT